MPALHPLPILLIAVSSNLDNVGVGTSYGVRKINIPLTSNLLIAAITAIGTFVSVLLGESVYLFITETTAGLLGGGIIILAGLWVTFQEGFLRGQMLNPGSSGYGFRHIIQILDDPIAADWDSSGNIDSKEAAALAFGLTINNIPNGVGAGMLSLNIYAMTAVVFLVSIVTIRLGIYLGQLGVRWVGKSAGPLAGLLLVFVGLYEILFSLKAHI